MTYLKFFLNIPRSVRVWPFILLLPALQLLLLLLLLLSFWKKWISRKEKEEETELLWVKIRKSRFS